MSTIGSAQSLAKGGAFLRLWQSIYFGPLIAGLFARLGSIVFLDFNKPNMGEYQFIAHAMLNGMGFAMPWRFDMGKLYYFPSAYMPPGSVMLDYVPQFFLGEAHAGILAVFFEQVLIGLLLVVVLTKIVDRVFGDAQLTRLTVWSAALYPTFAFAASSLGVINPALLIDALFLYVALRFMESLRERNGMLRWSVTLGGIGALMEYFRAESASVFLLCMALIAWRMRGELRTVAVYFICALLTAGALYAPWVAWNYSRFHRVIIGSTSGGFNFWRGHNQRATGSSWDEMGTSIWTTDTMWYDMMHSPIPDSSVEWKQIDYHKEKAIEWIVANPKLEAIRTVRKAALLWGIDWYSEAARKWQYVTIYALTMLSLIAGIFRLRRDQSWRSSNRVRDMIAIVGLWCLIYTLIVMTFFSVPRFQILMFGMLFPVIILGVDELLARARGKTVAPIMASPE